MTDKYLVEPKPLESPIAAEGEYVVIPERQNQIGRASVRNGFPPETSVPLNQGGKVVSRLDTNGFLNVLSSHTYWQQSGGQHSYNSELNYVPNNLVIHNNVFWVCKKANGPDNGGVVAPGANTAYWVTLSNSIGVDNILQNYVPKNGNSTINGTINVSNGLNASGYLRSNGADVATQTWVRSQGFLQHQIGAATVWGTDVLVEQGSGNIARLYPAVQRDNWGRVIRVGQARIRQNCNCDCCDNCCDNCGDSDSDGY